ncbi:MAG TPA: DNA-directed RNA polymerase subunit beta [Fimbriimonadaceae bacterium]|nr:DNA-directed RNA polymerase subunit beta [Fimbriimonadaceae bacterium]HRJ34018.1 DNA-directed RNA polymerase subunit beta [Fimbriimonadaceae bacterium]
MRVIQPTHKRIGRHLEVPNLIELQLNSYRWFIEEGLPELFNTFSPIWDFTQTNYIEFVDFILGEPKYSLQECRDRDLTFEAPIKATVRLGGKDREEIESEVYLGDLPLMTDKGTFIINGRERVIVSQLSRSPGLYFEEGVDSAMQVIVSARVIPMEGPWLEIESDSNMAVYTQISQTKKLPITQLIKVLHCFFDSTSPDRLRGRTRYTKPLKDALHMKVAEPVADPSTGEVLVEKGTILTKSDLARLAEHGDLEAKVELPLGTNEEMLWHFGEERTLENPTADDLTGKRLLQDLKEGNKIVLRKLERIERETAKKIESMGLATVEVLDVPPHVEATIEQDKTTNMREAILDLYKRLRPGEAATEDAAKQLLYNQFFDVKRYDLGKVGRRFLNQRLKINVPPNVRHLTSDDLAASLIAMIPYLMKEADRDDIDDLRNKRVRSVGELLQSQLRLGFVRMEKVARERMTSADQDNLLPGIILSVKPVSASIKSFFSSNQLSTFMDQTNPLSELTNKRRLSSLGPGGLQRTSAKLEVRDVHRSHYGRICPIETPEGPNIGLISQLTTHARVDEFGFIMTPYRRIIDGVVQEEIVYLTAQEDFNVRVAPADIELDSEGRIVNERVQVRCPGGDREFGGASYPTVPKESVDLMDISPVQIISVATALIPFLENDDANRALMGANMQRQAVPCLRSDAPVVGTGYERIAAVDSGAAVVAHRAGYVEKVEANEITVRADDGTLDHYELMHMVQSNKSTCFTHRPVVFPGDRVLKGDPLADGPTCDNGRLALGQNVLVAFMPWGGYNYEDAILISERLVKDDVFTSIHIERHETEAVDTKLGPEEITRDIPNVGEEALKDLDENGIIRVGAEVRPEDILVGKVAPKGQTEMTAEERLVIAIFGKKAEETRDVSLRVPHGERGTVVDVKVFSRFKYLSPSINYVYKESKKRDRLICDRTDEPLLQIPGDELPAGTNMTVQVYTAQKRKLMVGDKMAGRHGNKGVISKILPVEDMPMLADGTPVDVVLNPLGVPSRMNIGQIMETHLGYAGRRLGVRYECSAFEGATEEEILDEVRRMGDMMRRHVLGAYVNSELQLNLQFEKDATLDSMMTAIGARLRELDQPHLERISRIVAAKPTLTAAQLLEYDIHNWEPEELNEMGSPFKAPAEVYADILEKIQANTFSRAGIDPETCKSYIRDGLTGDLLPNPITVGVMYILKLEHLADEKIHARSIGPYSLVTQQPLGGKAQFGGQRFGEMEVWALEAYGAAYTLQELLTIKSDDVTGRVKAYESIVKGETLAEPGIPESFKILVNELRSLCLKVSVEDAANKELTLKDLDELTGGDDVRLARSVGFFN